MMGKKGSSLEGDKQQLKSEYDKTKRQLEELQEKHLKVNEKLSLSLSLSIDIDLWLQERSGLKEALAAAKKELMEVKKKVESLTSDLITEQEKRVKT